MARSSVLLLSALALLSPAALAEDDGLAGGPVLSDYARGLVGKKVPPSPRVGDRPASSSPRDVRNWLFALQDEDGAAYRDQKIAIAMGREAIGLTRTIAEKEERIAAVKLYLSRSNPRLPPLSSTARAAYTAIVEQETAARDQALEALRDLQQKFDMFMGDRPVYGMTSNPSLSATRVAGGRGLPGAMRAAKVDGVSEGGLESPSVLEMAGGLPKLGVQTGLKGLRGIAGALGRESTKGAVKRARTEADDAARLLAREKKITPRRAGGTPPKAKGAKGDAAASRGKKTKKEAHEPRPQTTADELRALGYRKQVADLPEDAQRRALDMALGETGHNIKGGQAFLNVYGKFRKRFEKDPKFRARKRHRPLPDTDARGKPITYREHDVAPSKFQGKERDARRIVTGDDGRVYYTNTHYRRFIRLK